MWIESHQAVHIWLPGAYQMGCLAGPGMPWILRWIADCATFEDIVLSCILPDVQMCSRCVPVHPDVLVSYQHYYMLCTVISLCGRCDHI